jgi:GT2 family glycosyltransferase/glycosyltransferase involved in cell wall biosynthesis
MKPASIIIPIYNAFEVAIDCLKSVSENLTKDAQVIVIDDCSPCGILTDALPEELKNNTQFKFYRNKKNLGFVGTCNRGMLLLSGENDVILLNSDTLVTPGWINKLRKAAYSKSNIATVTPLTNNGTIASVPVFLENNNIPPGYTLDEFALLIQELSEEIYVEAPTCVGFCTYITRHAITTLGGFDPIYGAGYGEENDFSMRARKVGLRNIIDDSTYIYHRGNMSFVEMREALSEKNSLILSSAYPHYNGDVAKFCAQVPLSRVHDKIWNYLQQDYFAKRDGIVLHVLHNGPFKARRHELGGTELHVQGLIKGVSNYAHLSLTPSASGWILCAHTDAGDRTIPLPAHFELTALFQSGFFDLIHVHHTYGFDLETLEEALCSHGNYIVSMHDYWLFCNNIFLRCSDGSVCNGTSCSGSCFPNQENALERRERSSRILDKASRVVTFSDSTERLLKEMCTHSLDTTQIPHGVSLSERSPLTVSSPPNETGIVKILLIGSFVSHKGSELLSLVISEIKQIGDLTVEWHFVGTRSDEIPPQVIQHGRYTADSLCHMLDTIGPHVALLLPQCQETYSVTLDELAWCGLPVLVNEFGALPERVRRWKSGIVIENSVSGVFTALTKMVSSWPEYELMFKGARNATVFPIEKEHAAYLSLYRQLTECKNADSATLIKFLYPDINEAPKKSRPFPSTVIHPSRESDPVLSSLGITS